MSYLSNIVNASGLKMQEMVHKAEIKEDDMTRWSLIELQTSTPAKEKG